MTIHHVTVPLAERSYDVLVGSGAIQEFSSTIPPAVRRIVVVSQRSIPVGALHQSISEQAVARGIQVATTFIAENEHGKSLSTVEKLCRFFAEQGITRQDLVVAVGGGLVCDVAGFAAAVWHRGTSVIHVATTLLAMVDAAVGGKTAVNLPEGKNLVGAFWQPRAVICDLDVLETLPEKERRCGLGEIAKYHFLTGTDLLALPLAERIAACVEIKANIVADDEREGGQRALLNYGHTLAHALETVGGHDLAHGEAVAIGLVFAAHLAQALGYIDSDRVGYHEKVVGEVYGLATRPPRAMVVKELVQVMTKDKKALDGMTFILDSASGLQVVAGIDESIVYRTLQDFLAES
jgi:5-deoxy-5-amino-3-dehydroquinate synthase